MPSDHAKTDAAFFRTLAGLSEEALVGTFPGIARDRKWEALDGLLTFLEADGFPNATSSTPFSKNQIVSVPHQGGKARTSLSRLVMQVVANLEPSAFTDKTRADALNVVDRCLRIHERHEQATAARTKSNFLDDLMFDATDLVQDAAFFQALIAKGAAVDALRRDSWETGSHDKCNTLTEAMRHQNLAAIEVFVPHLNSTFAEDFLSRIVAPYSAVGKAPATQSMAEVFQKNPEAVLRVLDALDQRFDPEQMAQARCRVLSFHLHDCLNLSASWNEQSVNQLIEGSTQSRAAMIAGASEDAKGIADEPVKASEKFQIWRELFEIALKTHCAPAVALFDDRLKASREFDYKRPASPMALLCETVSPAPAFAPQHFKATLQCLLDNGHDMARCLTSHRPAVHMIARTKDEPQVRAQKLVVLLSFGADLSQVDQFGSKALPSVKEGKEGREAWNAVARSYGARKVAMSIMDEMDAPAP